MPGPTALTTALCVLPSAVVVSPSEYDICVSLLSTADNLTAHAGGTQALGVLITVGLARFTTVATAGDSALLPPSLAGVQITVHNDGASSMNVFPATGETINAGAANAALAIGSGKATTFCCTTTGKWFTSPRVPS